MDIYVVMNFFRSAGMFYNMLQIDIVSCMPMVLAHESDFGEYSS